MLVMFLLWIILILLLIRIKRGKAVALVRRHRLRLDGRHGDLLHLWL